MDALLRRLVRTGLRRGLAGEHWTWLLLAASAWLLRRVRRAEERSTVLDLAPGERYLVRLVDPGSARRRKGRRGRAAPDGQWGERFGAAGDGERSGEGDGGDRNDATAPVGGSATGA